MENQELLKRAYASISALKKNLPDYHTVEEKYVNQYHSALDKVSATGVDVEEFRIPASEVKPRVTSYRYLEAGHETYSKHPEVERSFLLFKIDSVLSFFSLTEGGEGRSIGFNS